jgi:hypothetical protein
MNKILLPGLADAAEKDRLLLKRSVIVIESKKS